MLKRKFAGSMDTSLESGTENGPIEKKTKITQKDESIFKEFNEDIDDLLNQSYDQEMHRIKKSGKNVQNSGIIVAKKVQNLNIAQNQKIEAASTSKNKNNISWGEMDDDFDDLLNKSYDQVKHRVETFLKPKVTMASTSINENDSSMEMDDDFDDILNYLNDQEMHRIEKSRSANSENSYWFCLYLEGERRYLKTK